MRIMLIDKLTELAQLQYAITAAADAQHVTTVIEYYVHLYIPSVSCIIILRKPLPYHIYVSLSLS